jgi:hypothetical protein
LPVIDEVANDYLDDVEFVALAWKASFEKTKERADSLFSDNLKWGLDEDEDVFRLYGVPGQPASVIVSQGVIVDAWFGAVGEEELRRRLDAAVALTS